MAADNCEKLGVRRHSKGKPRGHEAKREEIVDRLEATFVLCYRRIKLA